MKKIFLFLILGMFLINFVSAADPTFQFNKGFDLKRGCSTSGFFCDNSFSCNITLTYPDGEILRNNIAMTKNFTFSNITISSVENNQLGIIRAIQSCNNATSAGSDVFDVAITADGKPFQEFPTQFSIILLGFLFIVTGFLKERLRLFTHLGGILWMVMGVITLYPGYSFINYSTLLGQVLGSVLVGMGFYFLIQDSFSRTKQKDRFDQDQGEGEENFDEEFIEEDRN